MTEKSRVDRGQAAVDPWLPMIIPVFLFVVAIIIFQALGETLTMSTLNRVWAGVVLVALVVMVSLSLFLVYRFPWGGE